ncbi:MAG: methyltransferase type 12 [Chloroflexi bacterium]|nr:MAG: methyltransferase type 12 [Chloroflexota bacterium]PIE80211.1 MAG: methyltransferase type 12 [Chloroflexota bacterium]
MNQKGNMTTNDTVWQGEVLTQTYLEGVRGAIPLANEQIDIMLRLIRASQPEINWVLDLGCGDGILGTAVLEQYPQAHGVFIDFSEPMLTAAKQRLNDNPKAFTILQDYGERDWLKKIQKLLDSPFTSDSKSPIISLFDVIVSGYSIHHQPDERKKEVYTELFNLLKPGGIFINIEHVASADPWLERRFQELFVDKIYQLQLQNGANKTWEEVAQEYYNRPDKDANILAPVEDQCSWLRDIGYEKVDIYLKIFELAIFGGIKPK